MAPRKRRTKRPSRAEGGAVEDVEVDVGEDSGLEAFGQDQIAISTDGADIIVDLNPAPPAPKSNKFDDNLAEHIEERHLGAIVNSLLDAIDEDERDRSEWLEQRANGIDLLGLKVEKPGGGSVGTSSTAVPGQSTVRDSILAEAVDMFQANAFAELCPSEGPCKVVNYGEETAEADQLAETLEKDFNFYLTTIAKEYYPDTRRMLFWTGYASGMFKKVYRCPLRRRPVSESVDGSDLIIPSNATDLHNAGRITHQINMRQSVMKRMQLLGEYRDVSLTQPTPDLNALQQKTAEVTGFNTFNQRPEDQDYTVYECYCELDIPGFEHKEQGQSEPSGLPLPYRVTIDKDSRVILEIRRNWREDDPDQKAKIPFVAFPYATGLGIYGTGLLHRLGNYTMALTAMLRECIDAGMFASFPGFLYAKGTGRQLQNEFRVPPGGGAPIDVGMGSLRDNVMPLPYKDVSTAMVALMAQTRENASRYGNMANMNVGEGKQDAPVGTTLALIEQVTKIEGGVHKALHAAQAEELQLLKELFREDPESLWRGNKRPAMGGDMAARIAVFTKALDDCEIVPASDPNVPSNMHRLAKVQALMQLTMGDQQINQIDVKKRAAKMLKIDDFDSLVLPPQPGQPDPAQLLMQIEMAKIQVAKDKVMLDAAKLQWQAQNADKERASKQEIEATKLAITSGQQKATGPVQPAVDPFAGAELELKARAQRLKEIEAMLKADEKQKDRDSKEAVEAFKLVQTAGIHPEAAGEMDKQLTIMAPFLEPAAQVRSAADGGVVWDDPLAGLLEEDDPAVAEAVDLANRIKSALRNPPNIPIQ